MKIKNLIFKEDDEIRMFSSETFNFIFEKSSYSSFSWGQEKDDYPLYNPISPETINLKIADDYQFNEEKLKKLLNLNITGMINKNVTSVSCISNVNIISSNYNRDELKKLVNYLESLNLLVFLNIDYDNNFSLKDVFKLKYLNIKNVVLNIKMFNVNDLINFIEILSENDIFPKCRYYVNDLNYENILKIFNNSKYPIGIFSLISITKNVKSTFLNKLSEHISKTKNFNIVIEKRSFNKFKKYDIISLDYEPGLTSCIIDFEKNIIYPSDDFKEKFVNINDINYIGEYWNSDIFNKFRKPIISKLTKLQKDGKDE